MKFLLILALNCTFLVSESAFAVAAEFYCIKEDDELTGGVLLFKEKVDSREQTRIQKLFVACEARDGRGTFQLVLPRR